MRVGGKHGSVRARDEEAGSAPVSGTPAAGRARTRGRGRGEGARSPRPPGAGPSSCVGSHLAPRMSTVDRPVRRWYSGNGT